MTKLKAAVIGVGSMGSRHARIYAALPETDLVAVVSATEATSIRVAAQYGGKAYTDYREMLAVEQPDVVSVAVPTVLHLEVATAVLEAGCHVLVEKPIAASVAEARTLSCDPFDDRLRDASCCLSQVGDCVQDCETILRTWARK